MAIFKINKTKDYTIMSNTHLREKDMSLKAKGLLSIMLSLPEDWDYSISGLVAICKENETAITSTLNELKRFGYVVVNKIYPNKDNGGRIDYEYNIYEKPQKQKREKQAVENLPLECQGIENQGQLNTNKQSTYKSKTHYMQQAQKESKSTDMGSLSYEQFLAVAKEECPTLWKRYNDKYACNCSSYKLNEFITLLNALTETHTNEQIREICKKANKMYCSQKAYIGCDLLWLLRNITIIEKYEFIEKTSFSEKKPVVDGNLYKIV